MALIKFGGGVSEMSGKLGGNVFARNRFGSYARSWKKPVDPASSRQAAARVIMQQLSSRWNEVLTSAQRGSWNNYASQVSMLNRLGEAIFLTGYNHYLRSNSSRLCCGLSIVDDGPVEYTLPETDPSLSVACSEATQVHTVTFDDTMDVFDESGGALQLHMGQPSYTSINFFAGPWRFIDSIDGDGTTPPTSPAALTGTPYVFSEGQTIYYQARILRADGRISNLWQTSVTAGA